MGCRRRGPLCVQCTDCPHMTRLHPQNLLPPSNSCSGNKVRDSPVEDDGDVPEGGQDTAVIVRPAEVVFLIRRGQQLHPVLLVHLTLRYASDTPAGLVFYDFHFSSVKTFPRLVAKVSRVQIKVCVVMFYVSYLKKKISRIRLYQDKVCVGVLYSTSARNLEENKLLQSSL